MIEREDLLDNEGQEAQTGGLASKQDRHHDAKMAWWREARVGMFIHWGLYSLPGGIWKGEEVRASYAEHLMLRAQIPIAEYEEITGQFRAEHFDAKQWVQLAKMAGLQYLIFTAKHHEGFSMYDSEVSTYNIVQRTPFGRDPLRELADACREEGIKLCIYYSHSMDWHHPDSQGNTWDYPGNIGAYDNVAFWITDEDKRTRYEHYLHTFALPQVKELLEKYGPVGLIWFDCGHKLTAEQGAAFIEQIQQVQPDCLVNRRVWMEPYGDYGNSSDNQPHVRVPREDWESIATLNDSWGYKANDHNWKSAETTLRQMIDVLSLNGNFVINVGPMGDGSFDPKSLELLKEIGAWMQINNSAVHGSRRSPIGKPPWGRCTAKGNTLYLHIFDWPANGELIVPGLRSAVVKAYVLADPNQANLEVQRMSEEDVWIVVPSEFANTLIPVIAVELAGECDANPLQLLHPNRYSNIFGAFDADLAGTTLRYDTGKDDHDNLIHWKSSDDQAAWNFRAGEPGTYRVSMKYGAIDGGGALEVTISSQRDQKTIMRQVVDIQPTGGFYAFAVKEIGQASISEAGEYVLRVKAAVLSTDSFICLKAIVLDGVEMT
ncbi:alpha-L-fucosidase [Paenibacillus sp. HWE-109]|uniref:alpha-L-fucosidase n=1 Tax=Paenibacillus sp. HWE-109 TaxID=1306526 RepID=UPI001EDE7C74|nr:alpha-L-fucosidase [Paenibacillus sp. HWE-109]UKS30949.1 alpha-L-fucosidase [Paenibacillus sp. HWE-109]